MTENDPEHLRARSNKAVRVILAALAALVVLATAPIVILYVGSRKTSSAEIPMTPDRQRLHELLEKIPDVSPEEKPLSSTAPSNAAPRSSNDPRAELLQKAIAGVGESCDGVIEVYHQGSRTDVGDFWNARCRNGKSYSVRQQTSGEVQVLSCEMLKLVAKINCFEPFSSQ